MPKGIRLFAENQPITHVIEAVRAYMVGAPVGNHAWLAIVWCLAVVVIAAPLAVVLFRRNSGGK